MWNPDTSIKCNALAHLIPIQKIPTQRLHDLYLLAYGRLDHVTLQNDIFNPA